MTIHVIITAGGKGHRFQAEKNKCFIELLGKEILYYSLKLFNEATVVSNIVLVVGTDDLSSATRLCNKYAFSKVKKIVEGGKERQDSVWNGLKALKELNVQEEDLVLIHDGARPLVSSETAHEVIEKAREFNASVCGVPIKDTVKVVDSDSFVSETADRSRLWAVQTPQCIRFGLAFTAFEKAFQDGFYGTDDVQLVERQGHKVKMVLGSYDNLKITTPDDMKLAEKILEHRIAFHEKDDGVILE